MRREVILGFLACVLVVILGNCRNVGSSANYGNPDLSPWERKQPSPFLSDWQREWDREEMLKKIADHERRIVHLESALASHSSM